MIKKLLVPTALATVIGTLMFAGCGGSSSSGNNPGGGNDAGGGGTGDGSSGQMQGDAAGMPTDGGVASSDGNTNPPLPDGAVLPSGTQLVPSTTGSIALDGVTSDDFVIYTDFAPTPPAVYALSLAAGSKPISLGPVNMSNDVWVTGKVVLIGSNGDSMTYVGPVSIWTSAASTATPLSTSSAIFSAGNPQGGGYALYAVSADSSHILYFDAVDTKLTTGTLTVAATDGTGKTALVPSIDLTGDVCYPYIAFGGAYAVAGYCMAPGDAGAPDAGLPDGGTNLNLASVSSFTGPSWGLVPIATGVEPSITVDQAGTKVVSVGPAGTSVYPVGGGAPLLIDPVGEVGGLTGLPGLLTSDGAHLVYTTTAHALERAATTSPPAPAQLVGAGFADVYTFSPDQSWVVGSLTAASNGVFSDLYLASATTAGAAATLSSATTAAISGDAFTADSSHVLFLSAIGKGGAGTLNAAPVAAAGTPTVLGAGALSVLGTTGAKVIFDANYAKGSADLLAVDTSKTTAPTVLVSVADGASNAVGQPFFLNAAKTTILYTWSFQTGANAGLWSMPAP